MRIALGADHRGFRYKQKIIEHLKKKGVGEVLLGGVRERNDDADRSREAGT